MTILAPQHSMPVVRSLTRAGALLLGLSVISGCGGEPGAGGDGTGPSAPANIANTRFGGGSIEVAADRLVITVEPSADRLALAGVLAAGNLAIHGELPGTGALVVRLGAGTSLDQALRHLDTLPAVRSVRFDPVMRGTGGDKGKKNGKEDQLDGPSSWHLAALRIGEAWKKQPSAATVVIALLDTGVSVAAPGLQNVSFASGYDFIDMDSDTTDDNGHGTLLASVIASEGPYPGVAPGVTLLPVKVLDAQRSGTESSLAQGIAFAVGEGADIVSMSLAFPPGYIPSYELSDAIHAATAAGVTVVAAAGNAGVGEVGYPAAFGDVIAVGAGRMIKKFESLTSEQALKAHGTSYANRMHKAEYSSWGAALDFLAPGGSMDHDLDGDGYPDAIPAVGHDAEHPTEFGAFLVAGTSPATAQASGVGALLLAGGAEPGSLRARLMQNANNVPPRGFDVFTGAGVIDASRAVHMLHKAADLPTIFANPIVTLADDPQGNRRAIAMVEVVDAANNPLPHVTVLGHFRGPVVHATQAVTDHLGRVLMVSNPAAPGSQLFEFGVDKVIVCKKHWHGWKKKKVKACTNGTVVVPGELARFEAATFRFLSAFSPGGQGVSPEPFMIFVDSDLFAPVVNDFGSDMITEPGLPGTLPSPVSTIPADLADYQYVEALMVRSFGSAASIAPVVMAVERSVLSNDCDIVDGGIPIRSGGVGVSPEPFHIDDNLIDENITDDEVTLRSDGGLYLNDQPTTEADLGLITSTTGAVLVTIDGSVCVPVPRDVNNIDVLDTTIVQGASVSDGGFTFSLSGVPNPAPKAPLKVNDTAIGRAIGQSLFSSAIGPKASAAVIDGP